MQAPWFVFFEYFYYLRLMNEFIEQASIVDIAPNLAGSVLAFCQTIHMTASFLSPVVAGFILTDKVKIDKIVNRFTLGLVDRSFHYLTVLIYTFVLSSY